MPQQESTSPPAETALRQPPPRWYRPALALIFFTGIVLRLATFAGGRALWVDEAMIGSNISARSFADLTKPLDHGQLAPVAFLLGERACIEVLGDNEYALRVPTLLAGLALLPVSLLAARRMVGHAGVVIAMLLVAMSEPLIYYSVELKPYALDALSGTLLLWLSLRVVQEGYRPRDVIWLALAGIVAIWFSFTAILVGAALFGAIFLFAWNKHRTACAWIAGAGVIFIAACAVDKVMFMQKSAVTGYLDRYWAGVRGAFLPLPPRSLEDLEIWSFKPLDFFVDPMRFKAFALAALLAMAGAGVLWKRNRVALALVLVPFAPVILTSLAKLYPFATSDYLRHPGFGRVILFLVPPVLIMMAGGLAMLASKLSGWRRPAAAAVVLALMLVHPLNMTAQLILHPKQIHDIRPAMAHLEKHARPGDRVYLNWGAVMVSEYYWPKYKLEGVTRISKTTGTLSETWQSIPKFADHDEVFAPVRSDPNHRRVWILYVHHPDLPTHRADEKYVKEHLGRLGTVVESKSDDKVSLHLFELSAPN